MANKYYDFVFVFPFSHSSAENFRSKSLCPKGLRHLGATKKEIKKGEILRISTFNTLI